MFTQELLGPNSQQSLSLLFPNFFMYHGSHSRRILFSDTLRLSCAQHNMLNTESSNIETRCSSARTGSWRLTSVCSPDRVGPWTSSSSSERSFPLFSSLYPGYTLKLLPPLYFFSVHLTVPRFQTSPSPLYISFPRIPGLQPTLRQEKEPGRFWHYLPQMYFLFEIMCQFCQRQWSPCTCQISPSER